MGKYSIICLLIILLFGLFGFNQVFSADDFEVKPPVMLIDYNEEKTNENDENGEEYGNIFDNLEIESPLYFVSMGYKSEDTWFDRRLNWSNFEGLFHLEYENFGFRLQSSFSSSGRDGFTGYDTRFSIYTFTEANEGLTRVGSGLSFFNCNPYKGQRFLDNQHFAFFANSVWFLLDFKFIMLINENFWNGGLIEVKLVNPFRVFGFHLRKNPTKKSSGLSGAMLLFNAIFPFELGFTGSFGLAEHCTDWGWHIMFRYNFEYQISNKNSVGFQFYWGYKNGSSESWEVGIKINFMGY